MHCISSSSVSEHQHTEGSCLQVLELQRVTGPFICWDVKGPVTFHRSIQWNATGPAAAHLQVDVGAGQCVPIWAGFVSLVHQQLLHYLDLAQPTAQPKKI